MQSSNQNRTKVRVSVGVRVRVRVSIRREMRLGEMRRHPSYTYLRSAKKWYRKNDERQNRACQRSKKRQSKSLLLVRLSKKKIRRNGIRRNATQPWRRHALMLALCLQQCKNNTLFDFYARQQNASRVLAIIWASVSPSVCLSVRPSVCHTRDLYQNGAS